MILVYPDPHARTENTDISEHNDINTIYPYIITHKTHACVRAFIFNYELATVVEDDPKGSFSLVTTARCTGWRY